MTQLREYRHRAEARRAAAAALRADLRRDAQQVHGTARPAGGRARQAERRDPCRHAREDRGHPEAGAEGEVCADRRRVRVVAPAPAVRSRGGRIYLLVDGKPKAVDARVGLSDGSTSEVSGDGIAEGAEVIIGAQGGASSSAPAQAKARPHVFLARSTNLLSRERGRKVRWRSQSNPNTRQDEQPGTADRDTRPAQGLRPWR